MGRTSHKLLPSKMRSIGTVTAAIIAVLLAASSTVAEDHFSLGEGRVEAEHAATDDDGNFIDRPELCTGQNDGEFVGYWFCGPDYHVCSNGKPIAERCPDGLVWDPVLNTCNVPGDVPTCFL